MKPKHRDICVTLGMVRKEYYPFRSLTHLIEFYSALKDSPRLELREVFDMFFPSETPTTCGTPINGFDRMQLIEKVGYKVQQIYYHNNNKPMRRELINRTNKIMGAPWRIEPVVPVKHGVPGENDDKPFRLGQNKKGGCTQVIVALLNKSRGSILLEEAQEECKKLGLVLTKGNFLCQRSRWMHGKVLGADPMAARDAELILKVRRKQNQNTTNLIKARMVRRENLKIRSKLGAVKGIRRKK